MQVFISMMLRTVTQPILSFTLYDMMRMSHDFEDVKAALNDRMDWSIDLFRSCFTIHLINGSYFFTLSSLFFLVTAENMRIHYGRLSPAQLKERAETIGYATFAILFAVLDIGFVIVRVAGFVALSASPALATNLILVSMSPVFVLPLLTYPARLLKRREHEHTGDAEMQSGTGVDGTEN